MSLRAAQELIADLQIQFAFEQIGENPALPDALQCHEATHFFMVMSRPGATEMRVMFSVEGAPQRIERGDMVLLNMSEQLEMWAAVQNDPAKLMQVFQLSTTDNLDAINESFRRDDRAARQFFRDHYYTFRQLPFVE
jgi:hypothetical protein